MRFNAISPALACLALAAFAGCDEPYVQTSRITLPGGQLTLGSERPCSDEKGPMCAADRAPHRARISPFEMDKTEVTRFQYSICQQKNGCRIAPLSDNQYGQRQLPVLVNTPKAAQDYCDWLGLDLPTEAEFEYAARLGPGDVQQDFPWGNGCDKMDHAACGGNTGGPLGNVGSHPLDSNGRGVLDLAGSVGEWVKDEYVAQIGCLDRLSLGAICGADLDCPEAQCTAVTQSGGDCVRGCLPDSIARGDGAIGDVLPRPACVANTASVVEDPLSPYAAGGDDHSGVVRGGSSDDRACSLAGWTRRHATPGGTVGFGFRCVLRGQKPQRPTSYRFTLDRCPSPDYPVQITFTQAMTPASVEVTAWPHVPGPVAPVTPRKGVLDQVRCQDAYIVVPRDYGVLDVKIADYQGCAAWASRPDVQSGYDVPASGVDVLRLAGNDESKCVVPHGQGNCTGGKCTTSCEADWYKKNNKADPGYRDCNGAFVDGCETDVMNDAAHCGTCAVACPTPKTGTVYCDRGACKVQTCITGRADCNQDPADGCEIQVDGTDRLNCGGCRVTCSGNNIIAACHGGACDGECLTGWADCNGNKQKDGCETNITTTANCGACGVACAQGQVCVNGRCM